MAFSDPLVYFHTNGLTYVAVDDNGVWWAWPAQEGGWMLRRRCDATLADACEEAEPENARLALRLSGAES